VQVYFPDLVRFGNRGVRNGSIGLPPVADRHHIMNGSGMSGLCRDVVEVRDQTFSAHAKIFEWEERWKIWSKLNETYPQLRSLQEKTDREIPVAAIPRNTRAN
jgi:hypothetical protein